LLLTTEPKDAASRLALTELKSWDGNASLSSAPATIFAYWYRQISLLTPPELAALSHWPEPLFLQQQLKDNGHYCQINGAKNCHDFLSQSLLIAMQKLTNDLGNDPNHWQWQTPHHAVFSELGLGDAGYIGAIWNQDIATPGFLYSINVGPYDFADFKQYNGASYRQIIDLNDLNNSLYIQTLGQSDDPTSPHHHDLMTLWRDGQYLSMSTSPNRWGNTQVLRLRPSFH
jgi:penicillin G amidase